jgi:hypothetical protein
MTANPLGDRFGGAASENIAMVVEKSFSMAV